MRNKNDIQARGNYGLATEFMKEKQVYTKQDLINFYINELGMDYSAGLYSAIILLSPRKRSTRGDCRGSSSNPWGHIAYNEKIKRKQVFNKTTQRIELEKQKYRFRYRDVALEPRMYPYQVKKIEQERTAVKKSAKKPVKIIKGKRQKLAV